MAAIDVGDELAPGRTGRVVVQGQHRHGRPQVGAANADIDDELEGLLRAADYRAFTNLLREVQHSLALLHHDALDVLTADSRSRRLAERNVEDGASFGRIDLVAPPHGLDTLAQPQSIRGLSQLREHDLVDTLSGVVHEHPNRLARKSLKASRIACEQLMRRTVADAFRLSSKVRPRTGARTRKQC